MNTWVLLPTNNRQKLFSADEVADKLIAVHKILERLITESENMPLLKWFELLFNEANIISFIMQQPDKAWLMQLLNGFFDFVQDECKRNPDLAIKRIGETN